MLGNCLLASRTQSTHWVPTAAVTWHSGQAGRKQRWQVTYEIRSGCLGQTGACAAWFGLDSPYDMESMLLGKYIRCPVATGRITGAAVHAPGPGMRTLQDVRAGQKQKAPSIRPAAVPHLAGRGEGRCGGAADGAFDG
ncbi:hypothetical protein GCM10017711_28740 [Paeniglutamicibacter sulfureus]